MSKKLMGVAALMAALVFAVSPASAEMEMEVGAMGGINLADVYGDDSPDESSMRVGFAGGGFFGAFFNENFGARVEVLYAMKGVKADVDTSSTTSPDIVEYTLKLDYIEIPVLAVARFPVSETFGVDVFAGPVIGFNMTADWENGETEDVSDWVKSTDFGAAFGIGGQFAAGTMNIFVQGRATIGLTSWDDSEDEEDVKNLAYSAMAGVAIPLGSE